jgi:hypothetical protein
MGFFEVLSCVTELLRREGRVSYRAIKREWHLDDASVMAGCPNGVLGNLLGIRPDFLLHKVEHEKMQGTD